MVIIPQDLDNSFRTPNPLSLLYDLPDWKWNDRSLSCEELWPLTTILDDLFIYRRPPACDRLTQLMAVALTERYKQAAQELLDGPFQLSALNAKINRWEEQIADAVAEDPNGHGTAGWRSGLQDLRDNLGPLRARLAASILD